MAEPIEMPFGLWAQIGWGAHLRNLTNTIEPSMCGGDAACCQVTLTICSNDIHRESKKGATITMAITLSILDRFAKFFHCCKQQ